MIEVVFDNEIIKIIQMFLAFATLVAMIFYVLKKKGNSKIVHLKQEEKKLVDIPPAILNYFETGKFNDKTFFLVLLGLIEKKFYNIYKNEAGEYVIKWNKEDMFSLDNYDLEEYEEVIVKFLNPFLLEGNLKKREIPIKGLKEKFEMSMGLRKVMPKVYRGLKNKIAQDYGFLEKEKNIQFIMITIFIYYLLMFPSLQFINMIVCFLYLLVGVMIGLFLNSKKIPWFRLLLVWIFYYGIAYFGYPFLANVFIPYQGIITWLQFFNPLLLLTICLIGTTNFTNPTQQCLFQKMQLLKENTKEKLLNSDKITKEMIEKYYITAEALNISITDIPTDKLEKKEKELVQELVSLETQLQYLSKMFE